MVADRLKYFRPQKLSDALAFLAQRQVSVVAGCTDVLAATSAPVLLGDVLDVTAIEEMRGISKSAEHWRIGGGATWSDIVRADLPSAFHGLKQAAREIGSVQIQNAATIAGNLCNASPAADGVPPLLTLNASVELVSQAGKRTLPLEKFLLGPRNTDLREGELLSAVLVPLSAAQGQSRFVKLGARKYLVISIVMAAARVLQSGGKISEVAIAVGSCSPVAVRLGDLEEKLRGQKPGSDLLALVNADTIVPHLSPITDIRASADYRRQAAVELVRRVVAQVVDEA